MLQRLAALSPDVVFTTVVTLREQLRGPLAVVHKATEASDLTQAYDRLLATVRRFCSPLPRVAPL